jgi:pyrimidine-nucleoside phosphorylase
VALGGGRTVVGEEIDRSVGLMVEKRIGESVVEGEPLLRVICDDTATGDAVAPMLAGAYTIGEEGVEAPQVIIRSMDQS